MLLAFDTATPFVTVALHDGSDVVVELFSEQKMKHGEQLAPLIEQAMATGGDHSPGPHRGSRSGSAPGRSRGCASGW